MFENDIIKINKTAACIKNAFECAKNRVSSKLYKAHPKNDVHWEKAAKNVLQANADPILFVEAQFRLGSADSEVWPAHLTTSEALEKYEELKKRELMPWEQELTNQFFYLRNLTSANPDKSIDEILMDEKSPIKNFVRIMLCSDAVYKEAFEKYGAKARKELELDPGLNRHLKQKYGTRYQRIFPKRIPNRPTSKLPEDPGPPQKGRIRRDYARRLARRY